MHRRKALITLITIWLIVGCTPARTPVRGEETAVLPSPTHTASPTPKRAVEATRPATRTPTSTATSTATATPTPTSTPTITPTPTPTAIPQINAFILGCDTSFQNFDETTLVWVMVQNVGGSDAQNIGVELTATDEDSQHVDRKDGIQHMPVGHQIAFFLRADTRFNVKTEINVTVTTDNGVGASDTRSQCNALSADEKERIERITVGQMYAIDSP